MKNTLLNTAIVLTVLVLGLFYYKQRNNSQNLDNVAPITAPMQQEKEEFPKDEKSDKTAPKVVPAPPLEQSIPKNQEIAPQQRQIQIIPKRFRLFHR